MQLVGAFNTGYWLMSFFVMVTGESVAAEPKHLVYPPVTDLGPNKVQLVLGLGIPMEIDANTIMGYVIKYSYRLPSNASYLTEPYVRLQRTAAKDVLSRETAKNRDQSGSPLSHGVNSIGRYVIYKIVESVIDSNFQSGKSCLLRAICEAATTPLNVDDGLFAQLTHVFLTPSSTADQEAIDQEYLAAEYIGRRRRPNECSRAFSECDSNFLDYFSKIY
ncbi:PREDICTED: uncharacterized protein LOC105363330 [Ceratosolen solmsi marchali]|uniref:Uncharacterized protein LOC105363330 n=1 Tax=Ceratosolen solmsi marchali TaxID=326594 RepID=A0AAJ6YJR2_9HYME|nr:PREDICTED: uncharacterized protein LOC105363330 [Ceratosolen solmsi marchali]